MCYDFANGLVVSDDARWRGINTVTDGLAIDLDLISKLNALTNMGRLIVHGNAPLKDELLHLQS
ncbi:hypothetical protein D3C71_1963090 [compost metagenome]